MTTVRARTDDLTTMAVDVVVNAANEHLRHGGGVAAALARAGGPTVQAASDAWVAANGPLGVGDAATTTAGTMPADHIVHVVGPRWSDSPTDPDDLSLTVMAALDAAATLGATSVGLPVISAGVFGYPMDEAAHVIALTASTWASVHDDQDVEQDVEQDMEQDREVMEVVLVGVDEDATNALTKGLDHDPLAGWPGSAPANRERPVVPDGYGLPDDDTGLQEWSLAESKLAQAETVWLATTRPDGRPHVVPRWGVWLDNQFFYDGAPTTRHVRNLTAHGSPGDRCNDPDNPRGAMTLHSESGTDVVIVNGTSGPTPAPSPWLAVQLAAAFHAKYKSQGFAPSWDAWSGQDAGGLCRFAPVDALAWANFPTDMTRWVW